MDTRKYKGYAGGQSLSRPQGTKVILAGRVAFLPNRDVPTIVQKLTQRQIAAIPRDKYAVAIIEPETKWGGLHAPRKGAMSSLARRFVPRYKNILRQRARFRNNAGVASADATTEFTTVITLIQQLHHQVETIYYENRELSRNNKPTPPPGGDIFLPPVDAGKMSDCIKKIVLDIFGDGDKGKICDRDIKLVEFCLLMHFYFRRIKILENTSRQPFCEYLENYVFEDESRFTAKTFNNYANETNYKRTDEDFTNAARLSINFKVHPTRKGTLQDAFHEVGYFFHNSPYFDELRKIQKNVIGFGI